MDEPEREDPQQPGDGPPTSPAGPVDPAGHAARTDTLAPPGRAHRVRGALASRAAGWVVAVALAGAVVALSAVLATSPQGLQVRALAGPAAITAIPAQAVTGPGRAQWRVVLPAVLPRAVCAIHAGSRSFRVILPARPGGAITAVPSPVTVKPGQVTVKPSQVKVKPGVITLAPAMVCPPR
jgi:hypothetical protein